MEIVKTVAIIINAPTISMLDGKPCSSHHIPGFYTCFMMLKCAFLATQVGGDGSKFKRNILFSVLRFFFHSFTGFYY